MLLTGRRMLSAVCGLAPVASLPKRSPFFDCCSKGIKTASYLSTFTGLTGYYLLRVM